MKMNPKKIFTATARVALVSILILAAQPLWADSKEEIAQEKAELRQMAKETMIRLYKLQPSAKRVISGSAGYGVFSNFGMKILVAGGGSGKGIVFDNKTGKETFMKMVEMQAGLGMGVKKFKLVWVFENRKDLSDFINSGWEFAAQTTAAARMGDDGVSITGALSVSPGIWLYQLTDDGLALELTGKGTKYFRDKDLN
jgi:lipid-binding SYLF domain-containing protein